MTRARDLANLGNTTVIKLDANNDYVGIGSETPDRQLDVGQGDLVVGSSITCGGPSGVVSATAFHGDGSNLTGTDPAGISTTGFSTFTQVACSGITSITNATASTSATTGSLVVTGGVGIAKSITVGAGVAVAGTMKAATYTAGAGVTISAAGIINAGFTTITGATETCTGVTTYATPDSSSTKVTIECDAAKGTLFSHDLSDGNVGIVSLTNLPVRGNSFTTYTILFNQLSSTPVGTGNTLPKNGIGTNVYLDGGFTGFTTRGRVASASTVTLSTTASDLDIVTLGVHYNGSGTGGKENFKVYVSGDTGYRIGND